ncbi:hypothetical protein [Peterkaempfera sp. SMS 1(5)a]|uniref:hypothetical protein n=1 Tax=Peterkaempfera podocarpi TaxID=3232308 RepID=UPI0036703470
MPIRPENRHRYPTDWKAISLATRAAAGWRCACTGQCGLDHGGRCRAVNGEPNPDTGSKVVLTVAHLNHEPSDCRPENLLAACQRCHLRYDAAHHAETRAATRRAALEAAGQTSFDIPA